MSFDTIEDYADHMANLEEYPSRIECQNCQEFVLVENFNDELEANSDTLRYCNNCVGAFVQQ